MCARVSKLKKVADRLAGCRCVMVELSLPDSLMNHEENSNDGFPACVDSE